MEANYKLAKQLFDPEFYRKQYPDITAGIDAFDHYLNFGWRERRNPSPTFDTHFYLISNPDVEAAGICPLVHYATNGASESRLPLPPPLPAGLRHFDANFYCNTYPDVVAAGIDALTHYLTTGWRESRNPSADFDTSFYLASNPDVAASGICPLLHFLAIGEAEGRTSRPKSNPARLIIDNASNLRERAEAWVRHEPIVQKPGADLGIFLEQHLSSRGNGLAVSISHDNYREIFGGVQNCLCDEELGFIQRGYQYLHMCPQQPLPMLADNGAQDFLVSVRVDGNETGIFSIADVANEIALRRASLSSCMLIVHHLFGFPPEAVTSFARTIEPDEVMLWIHDFFTLCPSYALLRNDVAFCFGPEPSSQACSVCCYGESRTDHLARVRKLLNFLPATVLAPSFSALSFWLERIGIVPQKTQVVPHGRLVDPSGVESTRPDRKLRIGFLGAPVYHKGWFTFLSLAERLLQDSRYELYHLGSWASANQFNIRHVHVNVNQEHRDAMIVAVSNAKLDVVINWSLCFETFSFTTHEAIAGGAFIVARRDAGNVFPAASQAGVEQGLACDNEDELFELFNSGHISQLVGKRRRWTFRTSNVEEQYFCEADVHG